MIVRPARPRPTTFAWPRAVGVVALFVGLALVAQGAFATVPVTLDGRPVQVGVGDTVAEVLAKYDAARPGDLVAASDGRVLCRGAGHGALVRVNGGAAAPGRRVDPGDAISTAPGPDVVESTFREYRALPIPTEIVGSGAILMLQEPGSAGLALVEVGSVSGDVVATETVRPSAPMVLTRMSAGSRKVVALTFDDGPWPSQTEEVLDILDRENVHATFFMLGSCVRRAPALARRVAREGHAIGNHSYSHADLSKASRGRVRAELLDTNRLVASTTGVAPTWFRPPGGNVDDLTYDEARRQELRTVLWTVDPTDWQRSATAAAIERSVVASVRPGSVVLLHDGGGDRSATVAALPGIIRKLRAKGYEFVLLDELPAPPRSRW